MVPDPHDGAVGQRVRAVLEVAALHGTAVGTGDLPGLLPERGPDNSAALAEWVRLHPDVGRIAGSFVTPPRGAPPTHDVFEERRERGRVYWDSANSLVDGPLAPLLPLVRCLGVTGSTAYLEPSEGDDIDVMAVTEAGATWVFLALAFLRLRLRGSPLLPSGAHWCLNYVIGERTARTDFAKPHGFHFAREALTVRLLRGDGFYRSLIGGAGWMELELPRLFRQVATSHEDGSPPVRSTALGIRIANAVLFPLAAAYLHLAGLYRNHRFRADGRVEEEFQTVTGLDRFELRTLKYERLTEIYGRAAPSAAPEPAA